MRRFAAIGLCIVAVLAGCKNNEPPAADQNQRAQYGFDYHHAQFLEQQAEGQAVSGRSDRAEVYEQQLDEADALWKLGRIPYNTYHTRRQDILWRMRDWALGERKKDGADPLLVDRIHLRWQKERRMLNDLEESTWRSELASFRAKLVADVRRRSKSPGGAQAAEQAALAELDAELGSW